MTQAAPRRRPRARHWIAAALTLAVVAALAVLAIEKLNISAVGHVLSHVHPGWVALAVLLMGTAFVARAESWYAVIGAAIPGNRIGRAPVRRGLMIGMVGSTVAPGRLGEAARTLVVARHLGDPGRNIAVIVGTLISQTLMNLIALAILAVITFVGTALSATHADAIVGALAVPVVLIALALAGPRLLHRAERSRVHWVKRSAAWINLQLVQFRKGLVVFGNPRAAVHAVAFQMLAWALQLASCYIVILALSLQHHANLIAAAAVLLAVNLTAIVPITPSNVGVFQAACIAVLAPFGVSASEGLAYGLLLQAIEVVCAFGLGVPSLLREGLPIGELRRLSADSPDSGDEAGA
jgi:phosphatidyl-myo-inositol alpha-mannosyltransferase